MAQSVPETLCAEAEFINASDMGQFVYCERKWFLEKTGAEASPESRARMDAGTVYHEQHALDPAAMDPRLLRWAFRLMIIVVLAILLLWLWL